MNKKAALKATLAFIGLVGLLVLFGLHPMLVVYALTFFVGFGLWHMLYDAFKPDKLPPGTRPEPKDEAPPLPRINPEYGKPEREYWRE